MKICQACDSGRGSTGFCVKMSESGVLYGAESLPPVRRVRLQVGSLLLVVGTLLLTVRFPPTTLQAETKDAEAAEAQQNSAAATNTEAATHTEEKNVSSINDNPYPAAAAAASAAPQTETNIEGTTVAVAESVPPAAGAEVVASPAPAGEPPVSGGEVAASHTSNLSSEGSSEGGEFAANEQPAATAGTEQDHRVGGEEEEANTPTAGPALSPVRRQRGGTGSSRVRKRRKKRGASRQETPCGRRYCYYLAESAFVSSAHLLPPPPPFTPPATPEGRAFLRAVALCRDSNFNLNVGKQFIYLMSSAVTYFQQSRAKCAIAYAQMFREEDVPVPSEEVLDGCAVALLRYSPDECWIDVPDPDVLFIRRTPSTKLIEPPPPSTGSQGGEPLNEADDLRRRQFKRAERLTLTLFKFSLVSRSHWCPSCRNEQSSTQDTPTPDYLPKRGYYGPKHEAWRTYLDALNDKVFRDLVGLSPIGREGEAVDDPSEVTDSSNTSDTTGSATTGDDNAKDVFFSAHFNLAPPWKNSGRLPLGRSWMSRGRTSPLAGGGRFGNKREGGQSGLGYIPAGAVFGGLTNPISRYAALLNYLQSRYNFQPIKYEIAEDKPSSRAAASTSAKTREGDRTRPGTTQTLTIQRIDAVDGFGHTAIRDTIPGHGFITLGNSTLRARLGRPPRKQLSSCDLMPQDQAAEAAMAALACRGDCVDTGEDLYKILRDGTDAPPAKFAGAAWSKSGDGYLGPTRLPRHPTAESLQRAYLNQLVSGCSHSQVHLREAETFYFAQAASLHFFGRFLDKCLQAMDEMTLPLFTRVFADESRGRSVGMEALQEFLPVPAPYSGADQLLVNCAAAALVASAMPPTTSPSNAAASAEAIAATAAAAGAPTWGAYTMKTKAAMEAAAFAYHHPIRGLMGRSSVAARIPCWEMDATRLPSNMSQSEFRAVVTSFADAELRPIPAADRQFLNEQLVPTVLQSLLKKKVPVRIFLGYKTPAARAFILARYVQARFKLDTPEEAGWEKPPPPTLSVEDMTVKAAEVAVNCGVMCTDTGQSVAYLIRYGLEAYMRRRRAMKKKKGENDREELENGHLADDSGDELTAEHNVGDEKPLREVQDAAWSEPKQEHRRASRHAAAAGSEQHPPVTDGANTLLVVQRGLVWIPAIASLIAALL